LILFHYPWTSAPSNNFGGIMNLKIKMSVAAVMACAGLSTAASAGVTFYENNGYRGRAFTTERQIQNFDRFGFNDRASSVVVDSGRWEVCTDARFGGECAVLRRGSYDSLRSLGLNDRISSVRPVGRTARYDNEPVPLAQADYEYRRRANERVYEAPVTSVRAVMGTPEQRCWVEREQVSDGGNNANIGGGVLGAIIGGVLGHQVGGGRGKDVATAVGAVAGGAIGANTGNNGGGSYSRDVQRCREIASGRPAYWDVTYNYRGREHSVQMTSEPGRTVYVNSNGEPRQ
jgi:uncharacterized protein YcfJ